MDTAERCVRISNSYYNLGLEKAKKRDLSGAVPCLVHALKFNKHHTDARNLLGLIYYEVGEVTDALVQWVISMNLQPEQNRADIYLDEIQRKRGRLEACGQVISRYNQALSFAQNENYDLAVLELNRAVQDNPKYVRANLLLALLLMNREEYLRAGKILSSVLKTDRGNPQAIWYLSVVRESITPEKAAAERKKNKNRKETSGGREQSEEMIVPSTYRENTGWQTTLNIGMGLIIGAAAVIFLYMPTRTAYLEQAHNRDLISVSNELNDANNRIESLTSDNTSLTTEKDDLTNQLNTIVETDTYKLSQYQKLIGILENYRNNNYSKAADLFATIDSSQLTDIDDGSNVSVSQIFKSISGKMNSEGYVSLTKDGNGYYEKADYKTAISYYDKALAIKADYEEAMFRKAMSYKKLGDIQNANNLFGEVIIRFPNTEFAAQAKAERGY